MNCWLAVQISEIQLLSFVLFLQSIPYSMHLMAIVRISPLTVFMIKKIVALQINYTYVRNEHMSWVLNFEIYLKKKTAAKLKSFSRMFLIVFTISLGRFNVY